MQNARAYDVAVVGHLCLDIIPAFKSGDVPLSEILVPGKLVDVGRVTVATGGATSNVGLALHKLGLGVRLFAKIGDDSLGRVVVDVINDVGAGLAGNLIVEKGGATSYTIVINPPGTDRIFLHSPGANDTFRAAEIPDAALSGARLLHFGYPPLMRTYYEDGGVQLCELMRRARALGCATSLDMSLPDPASPSGRVDWRRYIERVLPTVDFFLPSIDELLFMIDPERFAAREDPVTPAELTKYADILLAQGAAVVAVKLGDKGLYLKTTADAARLSAVPVFSPESAQKWRNGEFYSPCRKVNVVGTTGAGDCTIAGFLAALLRGLPPEDAVVTAVSVGGASVEAPGAVDGVPSWEALRERMEGEWEFV